MSIRNHFPLIEPNAVIRAEEKTDGSYEIRRYPDDKVGSNLIGLLERHGSDFVLRKPSLKQKFHLFLKTDSYGTNASVLRVLPSTTTIILELDTGTVKTTVATWLEHGEVMQFGNNGKQYFLARQAFEEVIIK